MDRSNVEFYAALQALLFVLAQKHQSSRLQATPWRFASASGRNAALDCIIDCVRQDHTQSVAVLHKSKPYLRDEKIHLALTKHALLMASHCLAEAAALSDLDSPAARTLPLAFDTGVPSHHGNLVVVANPFIRVDDDAFKLNIAAIERFSGGQKELLLPVFPR
ncbi:hypothetical protein GGF32_006239 [Allomyces javanicus]|nr:hypothetical protein GGF32_006239 [Allomyces javanicus]